jgi:hypothetical protein
MRIAGNPFIDEGIRTYFSHRTILRSYLVLLAILGVMLLLWWPRASFDTVLRSGGPTDTFVVIAIGMYFCLTYLSARYGSEGYSPDTMVQLREYVTLTPVRLPSVIAGKVTFSVLHTLFLLALGAPFLLASLAVSGVGLEKALDALLLMGAAALAARLYGLLLRTILGDRRLACSVILVVSIGLYIALTLPFVAPLSPVVALMSLSPRDGAAPAILSLPIGTIPFFSFFTVMSLFAGLLLSCGVLASLAVVKRHAHAKKT